MMTEIIQETIINKLMAGEKFIDLYQQNSEISDDETVMAAAIYQDVANFQYASDRLRRDVEFILQIADRGQSEEHLIMYADVSVLYDERILYGLTVEELAHIYPYLGLNLRLKPLVSQIALVGDNYQRNLAFVPAELWEDPDFALRVVLIKGSALIGVPELSKKYWGKPEFWWAAIRSEGMMLKHAFHEYREDYDFVQTAVKQNGKSLKYAAVPLRDDETIVKTAMKTEPMAWRYATERVQKLLAAHS